MAKKKSVLLRVPVDHLDKIDAHVATGNIPRTEFFIRAALKAIEDYDLDLNRLSSRSCKRAAFKRLKETLREVNKQVMACEKAVKKAGYARNPSDLASTVDSYAIPTYNAKAYITATDALEGAKVLRELARKALLDAGFTGQIPGMPSETRQAAARLVHVRRKESKAAAQDLADTIRANHD